MCADKSQAPVTDNYLSPHPNTFGHSTCWRPIQGGKPANYCRLDLEVWWFNWEKGNVVSDPLSQCF